MTSEEQARLVEAQLEVTRTRVADGMAALRARDHETAWLEACVAREAEVARADRLDLPASWLSLRLGLTASELRMLWVLVAHELCPDVRGMLRGLATEHEPDVTLDVLKRIVYGSSADGRAWHELSPGGPLRARCLIERLDGTTEMPAHRMTFRVARRVLALIHAHVGLDEELVGLARLVEPHASADLIVPADTRARVHASMSGDAGLVIVTGAPGSGGRSLIIDVAREAARPIVEIDARKLATDRTAAERQLRIIARECALLDRVALFTNLDALARDGEAADRLDLFETRVHGLAFATAARPISRRWARPPTTIELPAFEARDHAALWQRSLPGASDADAELLATMYPLAPALICAAGVAAVAAADGRALAPSHVEAGIRAIVDDRVSGLATRVEVTQRWEDLVLPEDQTMAVVELLARIRQRRRVYEAWGFAAKLGKGLGVTALFSGPPGTGKTMCAGLIARDLGMQLYQVDLGKIVSKWLGETQKNLAALFDAAEAGHAMLLFDEADALFGKRTAVTSSNDRHANQETNFLLQRIEAFTGVCVLTTNHDSAVDEAFRRRLATHVRFPVPDADERERLWRALIPERAPVEGTPDFGALAKKYVMSGGYIRNAVLRAAFLAADEGAPIGEWHLRHAAQLEYEAIGKLAVASA